jgi:ABC-type phosphate transport system substrate-binding protein
MLLSLSFGAGASTFTHPINNCEIKTDSVTAPELYGIFTLATRYWSTGERVRVVLLRETFQTHREFLWEFLGLSPSHYREIVNARVSSGRTMRPIIADNEASMIKTVSSTAGAIGYLGEGQWLISDGDNVKIIRVRF